MSLSQEQTEALSKYQDKFLNNEISREAYEIAKQDILSWNIPKSNDTPIKKVWLKSAELEKDFIYYFSLFFWGLVMLLKNILKWIWKGISIIWKTIHRVLVSFAHKKHLSVKELYINLWLTIFLVIGWIVGIFQILDSFTENQRIESNKRLADERIKKEQLANNKKSAEAVEQVKQKEVEKTHIDWILTGSYIEWGMIHLSINTSLKDAKFAVWMRAKNYLSIYGDDGNYRDKNTYLNSPYKWMYDGGFDHNNHYDTNGLCDIAESPFEGTCQKYNIYELITPLQYKNIKTFDKRENINEAVFSTDSSWSGTMDIYPYYPEANKFSCDTDDELRMAQKFQVWAALSQKCYLLTEGVLVAEVIVPITDEYDVSDVSISDGNGTVIPKLLWTTDIQLPPNCVIKSTTSTFMVCSVQIPVNIADITRLTENGIKERLSNKSFQKKEKAFAQEIQADKARLKESADYKIKAQAIISTRNWIKENYIYVLKQCQSSLLEKLKSPKSAEFPDASWKDIVFNGEAVFYNSYVDSQNSFSAMIRTNYQCSIRRSLDWNLEVSTELFE